MTDREILLWLSGVKNMWHKKMSVLLDEFGTPEAVFKATKEELEQCKDLKHAEIDDMLMKRENFRAEEEYRKLEKLGIFIILEKDEDYPVLLRGMEDRPRILFGGGNRSLLYELKPAAAIIGARICSQYGIYTAEKFAGELAKAGVTIISGMARGVDSAAHRGALQAGGKTVAVLGCGIDVCYPPENRDLYCKIRERGLLLSEYPPGTKPAAWHFPERNRLISALSDCVVITEAKEKSGSLITAKWALEQGIDVMAVPGRINDPLSAGCNRLIREGAAPVLEVSDIFLNMGVNYKNLEKKKIFLEKQNEVVYSVLGLHPQSIEEIQKKTELSIVEIYGILLQLELAGLAEEPEKNYYVKRI